jgi:hypothetical protein
MRIMVNIMQIVEIAPAALVVAACCAMSSCGEPPSKSQARSVASTGGAGGSGLDLIDPKDDVFGERASAGAGQGRASGASSSGSSTSGATAGSRSGRWSVILATFSGPDHAAKAAAFRQQLISQYPELREAAVRRMSQGSALVVGRFESVGDPGAQAELKRVKSIERNGKKPFAGAMLLRTASDASQGPPKPHDLRTLRAQFPKVRPLFSLQVAAWSTVGDAATEYGPMREAAERYCAELRRKGLEAWFLHDDDNETSIVTIGHFDRRAYDPRSTLYAPEVEDLMRQFPATLVNGEPVLIVLDPRNPNGKTKPQPCRLVEVPGV